MCALRTFRGVPERYYVVLTDIEVSHLVMIHLDVEEPHPISSTASSGLSVKMSLPSKALDSTTISMQQSILPEVLEEDIVSKFFRTAYACRTICQHE